MKKVFYFLAAAAVLTLAACSKPDPGKTPEDDKTPAAAPTADFDYSVDGLKVTFTDRFPHPRVCCCRYVYRQAHRGQCRCRDRQ